MARFLPDGQAVRREICRIFRSERGRRVALVAFVGKGAEAYLPKPKGLELVCWPHAPGTNPSTIRLLIDKKKVAVRFARRLHMKVYWTQSSGAVVASANLSTNAYGSGALHEAGVLIPSSAIDIDDLLAAVDAKKVTPTALARLRRAAAKVPRGARQSLERRTFLDWVRGGKPRRWLLHCFNAYGGGASQRLREVAKEETGSSKVIDFIYCRKGEVRSEDFVLTVDLASRRRPVVDRWFFAHRVVRVARDDTRYEEGWPFQTGQLHRAAACPRPPFDIDAPFRKALRRAYKELGEDSQLQFSIDRTAEPGKKLLSRLEAHYKVAMRD